MKENLILPDSSGGSIFYDCDLLYWYASDVRYAYVGGACGEGSYCGLMYLSISDVASSADWWLGASLIGRLPKRIKIGDKL